MHNEAPTKVYACAGASNVGVISFELTKALHLANRYEMGCSTCIGAGDCGCGGTVTESGRKDLLIDGCKVACLKKMFQKKGITDFDHVIVTQLGVRKEGTFDFDPELIPALLDKLTDKGL
ncbi:MAG: putative zinc-binding protein [Candidatus Cloacimonetes bacterium]|nr:putative zinc-binding protein [Candidatus Cloacimonadota bacterium]